MPNISIKITMPDMENFKGENYVKRLTDKMRSDTIPALRLAFNHTVEGWENRPDFKSNIDVTSSSISVSVYPSGPNADQYALVSKGSPPHTIRPKNGGLLKFQPGYNSATRPRILSSRSKVRFGNYVTAKVVNHPGFEAREFPETISDMYYPIFLDEMQEAMKPK